MEKSRYHAPPIPSGFIWRRAHSLTGIWLVLFLIEHLFTNSQAALFFDNGNGFVRAVNGLKNLPYLPAIEIFLLGIPFLVHGLWGLKRLFGVAYNVRGTDGSSPSLPQYPRNHAYTWQRITSWILFFGIAAHVIHMRFIEYPAHARHNTQEFYLTKVTQDNALTQLSQQLGFELYSEEQLKSTDSSKPWLQTAQGLTLGHNEQIAVSNNFGTAELLMVRDTFKRPSMILLYTGLVLAACFHAFNGLWTWMITWGVTLTDRSQDLMRTAATFLMVVTMFLGFAAIWGSYWISS